MQTVGGVVISDLWCVENFNDLQKLKKGSTPTAMQPLCKLQGGVCENGTCR
ncbi:MAG: hypothetical protein GX330_08170 [Bacteroidales bacterium]|nr:hypothetical protein [Bacteroidales bacterium]